MVKKFEALEFLVDDSGSMQMQSDTVGTNGRPQTRWLEVQNRLKEMVEILTYVPFSEVHVIFLNRSDKVILKRNGRDPKTFANDAYRQIDQAFAKSPTGTTPVFERLQQSFIKTVKGKALLAIFLAMECQTVALRLKTKLRSFSAIMKILLAIQSPFSAAPMRMHRSSG